LLLYLENINLSNTDNGLIFVILAIGSLICSITKKYKVLWVTGIASLTLIIIKFLDILVLDNLQFQPQWGIAVIIIGSILILSAAYRQHHQKTKEKIIKSIRNAVAYILIFGSISMLFDTISYLITGDFSFSIQETIVIFFMIVSGFFLLTKDNQNTSFFKNFISIVIGYRCLTHLQYKDFFIDFVFVGVIFVLQYEKIVKLNKHLNEKAKKRRFKKRIIKN
jgi:hypothetical protein